MVSFTKKGKKAATASNSYAPPWQVNNGKLLLFTSLLSLAYFGYSFLSNGFYQLDEVGHYLAMKGFWHSPNSVLGNWQKPGYKLIFILPVLLGKNFLALTNSFVAGFSCFFAYKLAEKLNCKAPLLAFLLLALQPLWVQLSFRNYSEIVSALLLVLAVLFHYKEKYLFAALFASYIAFIREEFYPILALYGCYLLYKRQFIPVLALAVFPLVNEIWGWLATDNPLYLVNNIFGTSQRYSGAYPRQGFDHYFKMSVTIFGSISVLMFLIYMGGSLFYKQKIHYFIVIPVAVFFLLHCFFNLQAYTIGPSTGGNLRYLLVIAPLIAVLSTIAVDRFFEVKSKAKFFYWLTPFALIIAFGLSYKHNYITLTHDRDPIPFLFLIVVIVSLFVASKETCLKIMALCLFLYPLFQVRPFKQHAEDITVQNVVKWSNENKLEAYPLYINHTLYQYYDGKLTNEYKNGLYSITKQNLDSAKRGSIIIWDSHFSYRPELNPNHVNYTYLLNDTAHFSLIANPFQSGDKRFVMIAFQKKK